MSQDQKSLKQIIDFRLEKLNKLREAGINPFPNKFDPTHKSESIITDFDAMEGKTVKVAGRIMAIR